MAHLAISSCKLAGQVRDVMPCTLVTWHRRVAPAPAGVLRMGCMTQAAGTPWAAGCIGHTHPCSSGYSSHIHLTQPMWWRALHNPTELATAGKPLRFTMSSLQLYPSHSAAATCRQQYRQDLTCGRGCKRPTSTQNCSAPAMASKPLPCPAACCGCGCPPSAAPVPAGPSCPGRRSSGLPCTRDASGCPGG